MQRNSSAGVIVFSRGDGGECEYLLLLSRRTKRPLWEFPKGGIEKGETTTEAALRELHEETGLAAHDIRILPGFERTENYRFSIGERRKTTIRKQVTYYLAEALRREVTVSDEETSAFAWVPLKEALRRLRYPGRRKMLEDAAAAAGCSGT